MIRFTKCFVALAGLVWALGLVAAPNDDLFRVAVPVESQAAAERARAASEGLARVLSRMTSASDITQAETLQQALDNAQRYIAQFRYRGYTPPEGEESSATAELVMSFPPAVIERLLREAELPYWPPNRPPVLVWLVEDTADGRILINSPSHPVVEGLRDAARERGLSLRWPLLDLEDQIALSPDALWHMNENDVLAASERYEVDTFLVGRISQTSRGEWLSTWHFYHRGQTRQYDFRAESAHRLGEAAVDPLADYLAALYAISPQAADASELVIQLSGIENFADYRGALDYLNSLAAVSDVRLQKVDGQTLVLSLKADGGMQTLRNTFALDRRIAPETSADVEQAPWLQQQQGTLLQPAPFYWRG